MLAFTVFHNPDLFKEIGSAKLAATYVPVASGKSVAASDYEICELAYEFTNSVDDVWHGELAYERGLTNVVQTRSTCVGDIVRIEAPGRERFYRCDDAGWTKVDRRTLRLVTR